MSDELPRRRRTLDSLKKEAKRWLDALFANAADARARLERAFPSAPAAPTLRDVQHALAREHGFPGWAALKQALASDRDAGARALEHYETMAEALLEALLSGMDSLERVTFDTCHGLTNAGVARLARLPRLRAARLGKRNHIRCRRCISPAG